MSTVYAVLFSHPEQRQLATDHCYGDCGKALVAAINDPELGELLPCAQEAHACPYLDKQMGEPIGTVQDHDGSPLDVVLRKLQPVKREIA